MFDKVRRDYILKAARLGSYEAAARELFTNKSTVARVIKKEEKELGFPLFEQVGHKMRTTPAGKYYVIAAKDMERIARNHAIKHENATQLKTGIVRVGASRSRASTMIATPAEQFMKQYPGITLVVPTGEDSRLMKFMDEDIVDAVLVQDISAMYTQYGMIEIMKDKPVLITPAHWENLPTIGMGSDYPLIDFSVMDGRDYIAMVHTHPLDFVRRQLEKASGATPYIRYYADNVTNANLMCDKGIGATLTMKSVIKASLTSLNFAKHRKLLSLMMPKVYEIANEIAAYRLVLAYNAKATMSLANREFINNWLLPSFGVKEKIGVSKREKEG